MKDFCKWLGVSDKIARLIIWLFIGMCFLIVTNVMLESVGLPYYKITVENLSRINYNKLFDYVLSWVICLVNFYSVVFIIFRIKNFKKIFPYSIMYLVINIIITTLTNQIVASIYIILFICIFCYLYSNKKWKYIIYGAGSLVFNTFIQYICYLYKLRFVDYEKLSYLNRFLTSFDFFIIIFVIIIIKEIIMRRKEVAK